MTTTVGTESPGNVMVRKTPQVKPQEKLPQREGITRNSRTSSERRYRQHRVVRRSHDRKDDPEHDA